MREILRSGSELVRNLKGSRSRKTLQPLQPSADDLNILVPSPNMVKKSEMIPKDAAKSSKSVFKIPQDTNINEKENSVRRSKRKNVFSNVQDKNKPSKEDTSPSTSKEKSKIPSKAKKLTAAVKKSTKKMPAPNQSSLDSYMSTTLESTINLEKDELSETVDKTSLPDEETTLYVANSFSEDVDFLTSDVAPGLYWKEIAELRRIALEKALYENSQLSDEKEVLAAENARLRNTIKEFEKITEIMNESFCENISSF